MTLALGLVSCIPTQKYRVRQEVFGMFACNGKYVRPGSPTVRLYQTRNIGPILARLRVYQLADAETPLAECLANVCDVGQTFSQRCLNVMIFFQPGSLNLSRGSVPFVRLPTEIQLRVPCDSPFTPGP